MSIRRLSQQQIETAAAMRERGLSINRIAKTLGVSPGAISPMLLFYPRGWRIEFHRRSGHFIAEEAPKRLNFWEPAALGTMKFSLMG
jgi:predicted transcriptional regulator